MDSAGSVSGRPVSPTELFHVPLTTPIHGGVYARVAVYGIAPEFGFYVASRDCVPLDLNDTPNDYRAGKVEMGGNLTPEMIAHVQKELGLVKEI